MTRLLDLVVVGAGPAGLAAAVTAADAGLRVALVDAGSRPGGQYYRHAPAKFHVERQGVLYHDWATFVRLRRRLARHVERGAIDDRARHQVWAVEAGVPVRVHTLCDQNSRELPARALVVATGAHDRVLPFPGWDLPGVMTAGGAQALLKGSLVLAGRRVVIAGTGPFLLPVAAGLAEAGADVVGVHEANLPTGWVRHLGVLARNAGKLGEAAHYASALTRRRVPYHTRSAVVAAHGPDVLSAAAGPGGTDATPGPGFTAETGRGTAAPAGLPGELAAVTIAQLDRDWRPIPGSERIVACDALAVGYGFTPQLELALELGCATRIDADGSLVVRVDAEQATSVPGVYAAGEVTGVGGAELALVEGELAGLAVARALGRPLPVSLTAGERRLRRRRRALRAFAGVLHDVLPVRDGWTAWLRDDTLVCRCEEVPYARLAGAVRQRGAGDPRSAKLLTRVGMGWCQGRFCGRPVAALVAGLAGRPVTDADLRALAGRPLAVPVPLRALSAEENETV